MSRNLVPIKVKIGIKDNGNAKYPNFNALQEVQNKNMDWSKYVDVHGLGWMYDCCGHKEEQMDGDEWDSPFGQQWGVLVVTKEFADEAITRFPNECEKLDETRLEAFYNSRHARDFPEENINEEALKVYEVKERNKIILTSEEETRKAKALDPNDSEPGIVKNPRKKWANYKSHVGVEIVQ